MSYQATNGYASFLPISSFHSYSFPLSCIHTIHLVHVSLCHYFLVIVPPFHLKILSNTALLVQLPTFMFVVTSVDTDLESGVVEQVSLLQCTLCISIISLAGQRLAPSSLLVFSFFAYPFSVINVCFLFGYRYEMGPRTSGYI
jgi:hypothetical protein